MTPEPTSSTMPTISWPTVTPGTARGTEFGIAASEVIEVSEEQVRELKSAGDMEDWNAGRIPVAATQPASTGHGLNLQQGGSTIIWFGLNWSLELYEQANARLWRQGQKETVVVHHLVVKGTMDEQVMQALKDKAAGQNALMAAVRARIRDSVG